MSRTLFTVAMEKWYLELALAVFLLAVCILGLALLFHLLRRWREYSDDDLPTPDALLSKFREMHSRGELSDEEFRKIKTDISARIQEPVTVSDDGRTASAEDASRRE